MIVLGAVSFLLSLVLTPLIRDHVGHLGFLDHPDGIRKKHSGPIPRIGGLAIALSYAGTFALAFVLPFSYTHILRDALPGILRLTLVASVVFLTGVVDDIFGLSAWKKLSGIGAAAVLAYWAGIRVDLHLVPAVSTYPWLGFAVTILWLVGCTNAFNLIDGIWPGDGRGPFRQHHHATGCSDPGQHAARAGDDALGGMPSRVSAVQFQPSFGLPW